MLEYDYPLFRPPAEANNLILQVTIGCSYNKCSFCSMYKTKKYHEKEIDEIKKEIDYLSKIYPETKRVFLADGDALALSYEQLIIILDYLKSSFPKLHRISTYASAQNILSKSEKELKNLCEKGLSLFYYGIESGNDTVLKNITKGVNKKEIINSLNRATDAGVKVSATVILGIGGKQYSKEHIKETADVINSTKITYLSTLQLGIDEDAKDNFYKHFNNFHELDDFEIINEQKEFLTLIKPNNKIIFRSNHASNALHLRGTLPKDKNRLLKEVDSALSIGTQAFIPKTYRGF